MHALVEIIAGMVAALAAAAMSQMGFDMTPAAEREEREIRRTSQGLAADAPPAAQVKSPTEEC